MARNHFVRGAVALSVGSLLSVAAGVVQAQGLVTTQRLSAGLAKIQDRMK